MSWLGCAFVQGENISQLPVRKISTVAPTNTAEQTIGTNGHVDSSSGLATGGTIMDGGMASRRAGE